MSKGSNTLKKNKAGDLRGMGDKERENLKKGVKITEETAREMGRKGALVSNQKQKERKDFKEQLQMLEDIYGDQRAKSVFNEALKGKEWANKWIYELLNNENDNEYNEFIISFGDDSI